MPTKSLHLKVPDHKPFDRDDCWFETFVGLHLLPIISKHPIQRFWFTRYGARGSFNVLFRFEIADLSPLQPAIDDLIKQFELGPDGYADYDVASDIGHGEKARFLGSNSHGDKQRRGEKAFTFLHATAELFIDCLSGPEHGYFFRERETASGFNFETPLEQYHHLFCNLTDTPTFAWVGQHPRSPDCLVMSPAQFSQEKGADSQWKLVAKFKIRY